MNRQSARLIVKNRPVGVIHELRYNPRLRIEFHSYPDAGHAFFSVDFPMYNQDAARDGWKQIWKWFGRYLQES